MDSLLTNITSTCPLQFSGLSGLLFAKTIAAVVAAQCAIQDQYKWPDNAAEEILSQEDSRYDFIIVGAGTAGSLLACRLSEKFPNWTILLIEAGDDPSWDTEIPALFFLAYDMKSDWMYKTEPDGRSCKGFINGSCIWNKGRVMGGSSSINAMIYLRGHPDDYDEWENMGNAGWSYKNVAPYFEKLEKWLALKEYPIEVKYHSNPFYSILKSTYEELDIPFNLKHNNEVNLDSKLVRLSIENGKRLTTAKLCLAKQAKNIIVMKNTIVKKVIIDKKTNTALGVEVKYSGTGEETIIQANKEVILSAGSIATPQILMLSGIGSSLITESDYNLPVGKNLQDHMILLLLFQIDEKHSRRVSDQDTAMTFIQYILNKSGPLSTVSIVDFMAFINTNKTKAKPDIQLFHSYYFKSDNFVVNKYFRRLGLREEIIDNIQKLNKENDLLGAFITLLNPKSRGDIRLSSSNPETPPIISPNYLKHRDDLETMLKAIDIVRNLTTTSTLRYLGVKLSNLEIPGCNHIDNSSKEYWKCYASHMGSTLYHPVGTTKMGPKDDTSAVVDENLKVYGIERLRVIDASIMPVITSGNTMAPVLVIAEKASDMIEKQYMTRNEL